MFCRGAQTTQHSVPRPVSPKALLDRARVHAALLMRLVDEARIHQAYLLTHEMTKNRISSGRRKLDGGKGMTLIGLNSLLQSNLCVPHRYMRTSEENAVLVKKREY